MKYYDWDELKNAILKAQRGICFEDVIAAINENKVLDRSNHPNQAKYPNQKVLVFAKDNYAYMVPFVEDEEKIFFKTIIPSRKATKKYIKERK